MTKKSLTEFMTTEEIDELRQKMEQSEFGQLCLKLDLLKLMPDEEYLDKIIAAAEAVKIIQEFDKPDTEDFLNKIIAASASVEACEI